MTDHMLYMDFAPERGWSPPEIKPYGPLSLDPACSCFQYCPSVFEGMKVCLPASTLRAYVQLSIGIPWTRRRAAFISTKVEYGADGAFS
jgi:hypothetical protein